MVRFISVFSSVPSLVRAIVKLYHQFGSWRKGSIDGPEITGDSVPWVGTDSTFHEQAYLVSWGQWFRNPVSFVIAQVSSSYPIVSSPDRYTTAFIVERVLDGIFQNPNHQFTMENLFEELVFTLRILGIPFRD